MTRSKLNNPIVFWVGTNMVGFFLANQNYISLLKITLMEDTALNIFLQYIVNSIICILFFTFLQSLHIRIWNTKRIAKLWATRTFIALVLSYTLNGAIYYKIAMQLIDLEEQLHISFYSLHRVLLGLQISTSENAASLFPLVGILSVVLGFTNSIVIGLMQAPLVKNNGLYKKWLLASLLSLWISFVFNSYLFSFVFQSTSNGVLITSIITGGIYSLATGKILNNFYSSPKGGFVVRTHHQTTRKWRRGGC